MSNFSKSFVKIKAGKIGLVFLIFFGIYLISYTPFSAEGLESFLQLSPIHIAFEVISTLILSVLIVELYLFIDKKFNNVIPWNYHVVRRWILQTIVQIVFLLGRVQVISATVL